MVAQPPKACSSCRFRKIKCDRRDKLKEANAPDDSDVKCSNCVTTGTSCVFISAPVKQRQGKRIRALRDFEQEELLYGQQQPTSSSSSSGIPQISSNGKTSQSTPFYSTPSIPSSSALLLELWRSNTQTSGSSISTVGQNFLRPGMFGIRGLTKQLLESCIAAYLFSVSPTLPIVRPDSFIPRLGAFFKLYTGEVPQSGVEPLDDLLVLASACAGSACLSESVAGFHRKFEILTDLRNAFDSLAESENGERLKRAGLDGVEAVYIITILEEDEKLNDSFIKSKDFVKGSPSLKISPTSTEGVVRIAMAHGLHIRSPEKPEEIREATISSTQPLTPASSPSVESEGSRRNRIWWCILGNDAFRAMAYRRSAYIIEDSFDHGGYGTDYPISSLKGLPQWVVFEFLWLSSMVTVTFLARSILPKILSERAQRRGVDVNEVWRVINSIEKWRNELPKDVTWEAQHRSGIHGNEEAAGERAFKCRLRALYLECLFHFCIIALFHGLEDAGFRNQGGRINSNPTSSYLPEVLDQPISTASVRAAASISNSNSPHSPSSIELSTSDPLLPQALHAVETLAHATFNRLADLLPKAASEGMIRSSPSILRGVGTAAIIWSTEIAVRRAREGASSEGLNEMLNKAENLISAVATCDSSQGTPLIVQQMREVVSKAKLSVKEILSQRNFPSPAASASSGNDSPRTQNTSSNPVFNSIPGGSVEPFGAPPQTTSKDSSRANNSLHTSMNTDQAQIPAGEGLSSLLFNLGTESEQVPQWLAEFVSGSGQVPPPNQASPFTFPLAEQQPWSSSFSSMNFNNTPSFE